MGELNHGAVGCVRKRRSAFKLLTAFSRSCSSVRLSAWQRLMHRAVNWRSCGELKKHCMRRKLALYISNGGQGDILYARVRTLLCHCGFYTIRRITSTAPWSGSFFFRLKEVCTTHQLIGLSLARISLTMCFIRGATF